MARLSLSIEQIKSHYTVVVIGSGYGGAIAASRMARAGQSVCLLERGAEKQPGEYPNTLETAAKEVQIDLPGKHIGSDIGMFDFHVNDDINVLVGCGLGGTSLINANVSLEAERRVLEQEAWPSQFRADIDTHLKQGYELAREMLKAVPYPEDEPTLPKLEALEESKSNLPEGTFYRPPINVNFEKFENNRNHVGVYQQPCDGCGDCVTGCNNHSKNTTLMNYLPDAKNFGAEIFTETEVQYLERQGDRWLVHYQIQGAGRDKFNAPTLFVSADIVILGAGALGSTEILLRSRNQGLALSERLGQRFSGNGDVLAFGYNCDREIDGIGCGPKSPPGRSLAGPCITGIIDQRAGSPIQEAMVIEEGCMPGSINSLLPSTFALAEKVLGQDTDSGVKDELKETQREIKSLLQGAYTGAVHNTQTYLVMSHDEGVGEMSLDNNGRLRINWPEAGSYPLLQTINERLIAATQPLGGSFIRNPIWTELFDHDLVSVHPLGGCIMGETADSGVVNHKGQVFSNTSGTDLYEGLYVSDGSVIPTALAVNPLLTISAITERACALIAEDRGWNINYSLPSAPQGPASSQPQLGLQFTETMGGHFSTQETKDYRKGADLGKASGSPFRFTLTVSSNDLDDLLTNPQHQAEMVGTVTAPALSSDPLTVSQGIFNLLTVAPGNSKARQMIYRARLKAESGKQYFMQGFKEIEDQPGLDLWSDTTTLFITIYDGDSEQNPIFGKGILHIKPLDFVRQMTTIKVENASSTPEKLEAIARFGQFFAGQLFEVYSPSRVTPWEREIPLYTLEGVPDAEATTHYFSTEDKLGLSLMRFKKQECDDVVLIIHGLTTSTDMFIMPEHYNLVRYLHDRGLTDVWCLDYRMSNRHSYNLLPNRYNMDDIALFDHPAAIAKMRESIGNRRIHVISHCLGANSFSMALFGKTVNNIASAIFNSVSLTPRVPKWSNVKLHVAPFATEYLLGYPYLNPAWARDPGLTRGKIFSWFVDRFHSECNSPECHMLSLLWGAGWPALYSHQNLLDVTHDRGGDLYGSVTVNYYRHVRKMVRAGHAVKYRQDPKYDRLPDNYMTHVPEIKTPVLFMTGEDNHVFTNSNIVAYETINKIVPGRHQLATFPNYGHQDVFMGKDVAVDIFPRLVEFINEHRS